MLTPGLRAVRCALSTNFSAHLTLITGIIYWQRIGACLHNRATRVIFCFSCNSAMLSTNYIPYNQPIWLPTVVRFITKTKKICLETKIY